MSDSVGYWFSTPDGTRFHAGPDGIDFAASPDGLDPEGRWVTIRGQPVHIDRHGGIEAGGSPELRRAIAAKRGGLPGYGQADPGHPMARELREDAEGRAALEGFLAKAGGHRELREACMRHEERASELLGRYCELGKEARRSPEGRALREQEEAERGKAAQAQEALQAALPELRRMLAEAAVAASPSAPAGLEAVDDPGEKRGWDMPWLGLVPSVVREPFRPDAGVRAEIDAGLGFFRSLAGGGGTVRVRLSQQGVRATYQAAGAEGRLNVGIGMGEGGIGGCVVHELGHALEHQKPAVAAMARRFLEYRAGGEKPQDLSGHGMPGEMGRADSFARAFDGPSALYVGKHYPGGETEIIAMGLEKLYSDPLGFVLADPEYAHLVIKAVRTGGQGGKA
jgi:hypothetical protein